MKKIISLLFVFILLFPLAAETFGLNELDLNRSARLLSEGELSDFPGAHFAFIWNDGDNETLKWRPQGIAGIAVGDRNFMAVSWYGREGDGFNYKNRGARISFVDITNPADIRYRHVLLEDSRGMTYRGIHAGGLAYRDGRLHVPDTRSKGQNILVFDVNEIKSVNPSDHYDYGYVLRQEDSYEVPVVPSFISFDWSRNQFLTGTFGRDDITKNLLAWYREDEVDENSPRFGIYIDELQGAASYDNMLYLSASYGRGNLSRLYSIDLETFGTPEGMGNGVSLLSLPPGLEDLHYSKSGNIWSLTEFAPAETAEGKAENWRIVFAIKADGLSEYSVAVFGEK